jgi:hypothetical protein
VNQKEANSILAGQVQELKKLTYAELYVWVSQRKVETLAVSGPSGIEYQIERQAMWDNKHRGDIRVFVSVDDGGWVSGLLPRCESFIVSPGESS